MLTQINKKVLSYCEIPEELTSDHAWLNEVSYDTYVEYVLDEGEELDDWIIKTYPELLKEESFLIHMDY